MKNSIKVVRSPSYNVDFVPPKDVALPQVLQPFALLEGAKDVEGCSYLSDYHDLPFNDVLDWRKFAVVLKERDVYELKCILKSISCEEFVALHKSSSSGMMHSTLLYINWRCGIM